MDRQGAIETLRDEGFFVAERQWSLGDSISVGALPQEIGFRVMIYLYPDGETWRVLNPMSGRADDHGFDSLADAVRFAAETMRKEIEQFADRP